MSARDFDSELKERRKVRQVDGSALGFTLLFLAGAMNGSFALPMKFTRKWAWENTWAIWTIFALFVFPLLLAYSTVPQISSAYAQAGGGAEREEPQRRRHRAGPQREVLRHPGSVR